MRYLILLALAKAQCPDRCNGKGLCGRDGLCECFEGYTGLACQHRSCVASTAWSDVPSATDQAHAPLECSNRGYCNRATGYCICDSLFEGFACEKFKCPTSGADRWAFDEFGEKTECSGHGLCTSMREAARSFDGHQLNRSAHRSGEYGVPYDLWDADLIRGCICDPGYEGYACDLVSCDKGDDRRTVGGTDEVAHLYCRCAAPCNGTLTMFLGGEETYPLLKPTDTSQELQTRLGLLRALYGQGAAVFPEPIQARSIPAGPLCSPTGTLTSIRFLRDSGDIPPLWVDDSELESPSKEVYMETNQTLTCSGANGGSFALVYDGRTTHKLDHDATATEVQHALHSLPTLNEGDVRVETLHSAGSGLCGGDALVIAFTTPLGNQPPLEIISSLLKNGAPGGVIDIQHTTGTRERLECNGAGFCDKAGNITIEFEATAPAPTNGTCACDEGFEWDPDYGSCGRPQFNTSAWTGLQRCPGYVTKDTALDPVDVLNLRYVYIADASNSTADEILAAKRKAGANISSLSVPGGMYTNGAISASRGVPAP